MKNRSFVRLWAPLIAALVFAIAFLATHFVLNPSETAAAEAELNALIDTVEARVAVEEDESGDLAADEAAIHKARTVERFLAHDDSLLQTDALQALCELIDLERVAVLDSEGGVAFASEESLIGQSYASDKTLDWCMALLAEGAEPAARASESGRVAGVPRSDIDGLILVWNEDAPFPAEAGVGGLQAATENIAVSPNAIKYVEAAGESGVFEQDGMLYVQRAEGEATLIAYRPLAEVHAVQNAVLTALAVFAALSVAALFIWQFSGGRGPDIPAEDEEAEETPSLPEPEPEPEPERKPKRKRRRPVESDRDVETEDEEIDLSLQPAPKPRRPKRPREKPAEATQDESFDKIFE